MLDPSTITAVGGVGTFMKSSDSGVNWEINHRINGIDIAFKALFFLDNSTGWATAGGNVYKTTDAGSTWNFYETGTFSTFEDIFFINENLGWAVAYHLMKEVTELRIKLGRDTQQEGIKEWFLRKSAPIVLPFYSFKTFIVEIQYQSILKNLMKKRKKVWRLIFE
jgi:hypothetical protein